MNDFLRKNIGESDEEYVIRLCSIRKELGYSWQEIANIIAESLGIYKSPDTFRKRWSKFLQDKKTDSDDNSNLKLEKLKVQVSDERAQNRAYIRKLAREDTFLDIIRSTVQDLSKSVPLQKYSSRSNEIKNQDAILEISDWHYGLEINNYWNKCNCDTVKQRVSELSDNVIDIIKSNNLNHINVLNLGDMVAGRIHNCIRLQSRIDIITQIIEVSELIAQFLTKLSEYASIDYYDSLDNHSRLEPKKEESLDSESLVRITTWFLKERLKDTNITIHDNEISDEIISFSTLGYKICGVHGHKDSNVKLINNICLLNKEHYNIICSAHVHHFITEEKNEVMVITNGSLGGTDDYAISLRENSKPSQNLIILKEDNPCSCIYRIQLNS